MEDQVKNSEEMDLNGEETVTNSPAQEENATAESELEKLKTELASYKDKYIRTVAEFDNFKRRNAKERIELMQTAGRDVITELLDVLDDCERAKQTLEKEDLLKRQSGKESSWFSINSKQNCKIEDWKPWM